MTKKLLKPKPKRKTCSCCGAPVVEYKHALSLGMVEILWIAYAEGNGDWRQPFKVSNNESFTYSQRCNFQKLRYWRLVEKTDEGWWQTTPLAEEFLRGEASLPARAWTYRGQIARERTDAEELVTIQSIAPERQLPGRRDYASTAQAANDDDQISLF